MLFVGALSQVKPVLSPKGSQWDPWVRPQFFCFIFWKQPTLLWLLWRSLTRISAGTTCRVRSRATPPWGELLAGTSPWAWSTTGQATATSVSPVWNPFLWAGNLFTKKVSCASKIPSWKEEMEKMLLFKVSLSKMLGFWHLLQSKIWHISCFGGLCFLFTSLPFLLQQPKRYSQKGNVGCPTWAWCLCRVWSGVKRWNLKGGDGLRTGDRGWFQET